jgi:hypothetical protein
VVFLHQGHPGVEQRRQPRGGQSGGAAPITTRSYSSAMTHLSQGRPW